MCQAYCIESSSINNSNIEVSYYHRSFHCHTCSNIKEQSYSGLKPNFRGIQCNKKVLPSRKSMNHLSKVRCKCHSGHILSNLEDKGCKSLNFYHRVYQEGRVWLRQYRFDPQLFIQANLKRQDINF